MMLNNAVPSARERVNNIAFFRVEVDFHRSKWA
jgi:hypothetical protein